MRSLRIAQLVLPWIPLPPPGYAGTERVVYHLTEELVKRGHQVTLFASGDSKTSAKLEAIIPKAMGLQENVKSTLGGSFYPMLHVAHCFEMGDQFDIIHSHSQFLGLPFGAVCKTPSIHTFHRIFEFTNPDEKELVFHFGNKLNFTSISNAQRVDGVHYVATVYNGVDTDTYRPLSFGGTNEHFDASSVPSRNSSDPSMSAPSLGNEKPQNVTGSPSGNSPTRDYLFWAGRVIDKKGPEEAIKVAHHLKMNLVMAGEVTEVDYFEKKIRPHIDGVHVQLAQHENREHIIALYQNAKVTIVPTKWTEPFGLVPVESMACGTPVVSYDRGGVAETIAEGTGYLVKEEEGVEGLIRRVKQIIDLSPDQYGAMCEKSRAHVLDHFSIGKMTDGYEAVYAQILGL
ncbi:MAG TPA: glycosyltransferase family 4 protein [Patescibacteria group bacterium]|nr:glycosyltransferase family 4 protein [Patescibacteria group bacterium]